MSVLKKNDGIMRKGTKMHGFVRFRRLFGKYFLKMNKKSPTGE